MSHNLNYKDKKMKGKNKVHPMEASSRNIAEENPDLDTALHLAIRRHDTDEIRALLFSSMSKSDLNHKNRQGITPLLAMIAHFPQHIERLIQAVAEVNIADNQGVTPLHLPEEKGN